MGGRTLLPSCRSRTDTMNEQMQCHLSDALSAAANSLVVLLPTCKNMGSKLEGHDLATGGSNAGVE